jgi:prepilin-type N-terminal cleavage/methylation domain-containing protein
MIQRTVKKAFTLVEILIVVVILGILAAIVIPQFTKASEDAQMGNAKTQLATVRRMIELYRVKNNGQYPFGASPVWTNLVGADYLAAAPVNPRTGKSDIVTGTSWTSGTTTSGWVWDNSAKKMFMGYFQEGDPTSATASLQVDTWTGP